MEGEVQAPAFDPAPGKWSAGMDADTVGYITNRGLDKLSVADAIKKTIESHRNAETKLGVPPEQLLRIPKDAADAEGWNKIHSALGKPKDAKDYDFSAAKDADEGFINFARKWAFDHNLPKTVGEAFVKDMIEWDAGVDAREGQEREVKVNAERAQLKKDWGFNERANLLTAQNAIKKFSIDPQAVSALEGQVGYAAVMNMFLKLGQLTGEARFITSEYTGEAMTAGGAKEKIEALKKDPEWVKRYQDGGTKSKEFKEMQDLMRLASGIGAPQ